MPSPSEPTAGSSPPEKPAPEHADPQGEVVAALRKDKLRAALFGEERQVRHIGRYRVIGTLGRGGMGTVLEAVDDRLERRVALKLLHRDLSPLDQRRLLREARALARLSHPHVVQVHEVAEQPQPFIAMELVRGQTLTRWQRERRSARAYVEAYLQAGRGLAAAHQQRLVHRDFKPDNCIIDDEGRVRVMDFGLARSTDAAPSQHESASDDTTDSSVEVGLTVTGAVMGTLAYMSPEQLEGREIDARSDQFSFCVALYEALHGHRPFAGRSARALSEAIQHGAIREPPRGSASSRALRRILHRGLAADPTQRWNTMNQLLEALERTVRPRWRSRLVGGAVVVGLSLSGFAAWTEWDAQQACAGADHQLDAVWDSARRDEVRDALLNSDVPYATSAWNGVEPRLDEYADAWGTAWADACRSSQVERDEPEVVTARRTTCLHERKIALRDAVDVLAQAQPATVERAVSLVSRLPSVERCHDVPALLAELPPPADERVRVQVQSLRDQLSEARTLRLAGRYSDSLALIERMQPTAAQIGHPALDAEIDLQRGWALYELGRHDDAAAVFQVAYSQGTAEGHDQVAAQAASLLSYIVGVRQSKQDAGVAWGLSAQAMAQRPAAEPGSDGLAAANLAAVYHHHGEHELAIERFGEALTLQEQAHGTDDVRLAFAISGMALALDAVGRYDEGMVHHDRALALRRNSLGPQHPHVGIALNDIGVALHRQGQFHEAADYLERALEIKTANLGPEHPALVAPLSNLGAMAIQSKRYEEGLALLQRANAIAEHAEGPYATMLESTLLNTSFVLQNLDRVEEAEATLRRNIAVIEHNRGPQSPKLVRSLSVLTHMMWDKDDQGAAAETIDRALAIAERSKVSPVELSSLLLTRATHRKRYGDPASAVLDAQRALTLRQDADARLDLRMQARLALAKAEARVDGADPERAVNEAEAILAALADDPDPRSEWVRDDAQQWLDTLRRPDPPR